MLTVKLSKALERVFAFSTGARVRHRAINFDVDSGNAYSAADVVCQPHEIPNAVQHPGGSAYLTDIKAWDKDDQAVALDVYICSTSKPLGSNNAAVSIADADIVDIKAKVPIASGDWADLINSRFCNKVLGDTGLPTTISAEPGSRSLWVSIVNGAGTPTFTDGNLRMEFVFQDAVQGD